MRAVVAARLVAAALALASSSCACGPEPAPRARPLFSADPTSIDNALPDARLVDDDLGLQLRPGWFEPFLPDAAHTHESYALFDGYAAHLAGARGFGTFTPFFVRFDAPPVELDARALALVRLDADHRVDVTAAWHADPPYLLVHPTEPLGEGGRYALVGTRALGDVGRGDAFAAWATGEGEAALDVAAQKAGVAADDVVLYVETVVDRPTVDLVAAVARVADRVPSHDFAVDAPRLRGVWAKGQAPAELRAVPSAGAIAIGAYDPIDARGDDDVFSPAFLAGDDDGVAQRVEFVLVEPDPGVHPPPWPTVVVQHGFNGQNRFVLEVAEEFVARGLACIGITAVQHGERGSVTAFFDLHDVRVARDNFRQTVLDQVQLATLAARGGVDVDGVAGPDLDGRILYFGHSMGAILGSVLAGVAPSLDVSVVNAAGGGMGGIFQSEGLTAMLQLLVRPALGMTYEDPAYPDVLPFYAGFLQTIFAPADPISYAARARERHERDGYAYLLQEDTGDRLVPNAASADLARALGLATHDEARDFDHAAFVHWRLDPAALGFPAADDPHGIYFATPGARAQAAAFLASGGRALLDPAAP